MNHSSIIFCFGTAWAPAVSKTFSDLEALSLMVVLASDLDVGKPSEIVVFIVCQSLPGWVALFCVHRMDMCVLVQSRRFWCSLQIRPRELKCWLLFKFSQSEPAHMQLWWVYQSRGWCLQQVSTFCSFAYDGLIIAEANSWDANIRVRVPYFFFAYCAYISNSFLICHCQEPQALRFLCFFKFHCWL